MLRRLHQDYGRRKRRLSGWTPAKLSPIAWYKGDGDATDAMGNYNGTWAGTEAYADGPTGQAFDFDGSAFVNIGPTAVSRDITVAFWVYITTSPTTGKQHVGVLNKVAFRTGGSGGRLNWNIWNQDSIRRELAPSPETINNSWCHYVGTWDGKTSSVFVDGVLEGERPFLGTSMGSLGSSLAIGPSIPGYIFDDVLIFDRALTPLEISTLYNESINKNGKAW